MEQYLFFVNLDAKLYEMNKLTLFFLFAFLPIFMTAREIPRDKALKIAEDFLSPQMKTRSLQEPDLKMVYDGSSHDTRSSDHPAFYAFDNIAGPGFVIVAGEDSVRPILGYSFDNEFIAEDIPANIRHWFADISDEIYHIRTMSRASVESSAEPETGEVVLLYDTAAWDQEDPYNSMCPMDGDRRSAVGCLATATAIVMRHRQWPEKGLGTIPGYESQNGIKIPSINLGHEYDWENMPLNPPYTDEQVENIARLMAECGAMIESDYSATGTSSYLNLLMEPLRFHMDYDASMAKRNRKSYRDDEWHMMLKSELETNGPMIYGGEPETGNGHAFVLDGYTSADYYSVNWGWGGSCNGFYVLEAMNPTWIGVGVSEGGFNRNQTALFNVKKNEGGSPELDFVYTYGSRDGHTYLGLTTSSSVFEPGVPFTLSAGVIYNYTKHYDYSGPLRIVVLDKDGDMKEVLYEVDVELKDALTGSRTTYFVIHDLEVTFTKPLAVGDHVACQVYDQARYGWVKVLGAIYGPSVEPPQDEIHLCDELTIGETTTFSYDRTTGMITMTVKDGVDVSLSDDAGNNVGTVMVKEGNDVEISTFDLASGRYEIVLTKSFERKVLSFVVGHSEKEE